MVTSFTLFSLRQLFAIHAEKQNISSVSSTELIEELRFVNVIIIEEEFKDEQRFHPQSI